ncbi:uncharacterized protein LOC127467504 isoform X2 [Manacus candei]|uniref:uncharacterized protein LOC127467504 isoform X2 n=1 Tax=Manacus candei TaxID=415023 RepID=UPI002226FC45|nr:uncharacterized protein LOC127467504 isoform X2 [Manacus candei]
MGKKFLAGRVGRPWHRLPREAGAACAHSHVSPRSSLIPTYLHALPSFTCFCVLFPHSHIFPCFFLIPMFLHALPSFPCFSMLFPHSHASPCSSLIPMFFHALPSFPHFSMLFPHSHVSPYVSLVVEANLWKEGIIWMYRYSPLWQLYFKEVSEHGVESQPTLPKSTLCFLQDARMFLQTLPRSVLWDSGIFLLGGSTQLVMVLCREGCDHCLSPQALFLGLVQSESQVVVCTSKLQPSQIPKELHVCKVLSEFHLRSFPATIDEDLFQSCVKQCFIPFFSCSSSPLTSSCACWVAPNSLFPVFWDIAAVGSKPVLVLPQCGRFSSEAYFPFLHFHGLLD